MELQQFGFFLLYPCVNFFILFLFSHHPSQTEEQLSGWCLGSTCYPHFWHPGIWQASVNNRLDQRTLDSTYGHSSQLLIGRLLSYSQDFFALLHIGDQGLLVAAFSSTEVDVILPFQMFYCMDIQPFGLPVLQWVKKNCIGLHKKIYCYSCIGYFFHFHFYFICATSFMNVKPRLHKKFWNYF